MMPSEPTNLPNAGALRSGRNTNRWQSSPMSAAIARAIVNAEHAGRRSAGDVDSHRQVETRPGEHVEPGQGDVAGCTQLRPRISGVHRDRALREVDDSRALEPDDQALAQMAYMPPAASP